MKTGPFHRAAAMFAALAAASQIADFGERTKAYDKIGQYKSRGKSGKRPRHSSRRFVAQDKRDARKARNRRR